MEKAWENFVTTYRVQNALDLGDKNKEKIKILKMSNKDFYWKKVTLVLVDHKII